MCSSLETEDRLELMDRQVHEMSGNRFHRMKSLIVFCSYNIPKPITSMASE